jgi:hypothetical protein
MDSLSGDEDLWLARFCAIISRYLRSAGDMSPRAGAAEFTGPTDYAFLRSVAGEAHIESLLWPAWQELPRTSC